MSHYRGDELAETLTFGTHYDLQRSPCEDLESDAKLIHL